MGRWAVVERCQLKSCRFNFLIAAGVGSINSVNVAPACQSAAEFERQLARNLILDVNPVYDEVFAIR